jgi:ubiquitin carboxyl-terminal hydrolase 7
MPDSHALAPLSNPVKDEKFSETKKRLEKRTGIKGKNFEKIKFALVQRALYSKPTYITDDGESPFLLVGH